MLRRFLMALFALHVLLSGGVFTFDEPTPAGPAPVACAAHADGLCNSLAQPHTETATADTPDDPVRFLLVLNGPAPALRAPLGRFAHPNDPAPWSHDRPPRRSPRA